MHSRTILLTVLLFTYYVHVGDSYVHIIYVMYMLLTNARC